MSQAAGLRRRTPLALSIGEHSRWIKHSAVLVVEVGERHGMDFIRRPQAAVKVSTREGEARLRDQIAPSVSSGRLRAVTTFDGRVFTIFYGRKSASRCRECFFYLGSHGHDRKNGYNA
jgi:hypothetical protein